MTAQVSDSTAKELPKREQFVREFLIDLNATQAAIRAGYSEKSAKVTASRLLSDANVQAALKAGMEARAERTEITADYVLTTIQRTVERCQELHPVRDKSGKLVEVEVQTEDGIQKTCVAVMFNAKAVLQGCELLGRHLAMWRDRVEHTGKDGSPLIPELGPESARRMAFLLNPPERAEVRH